MTSSKLEPQNERMVDLSDKNFLNVATMVILDNIADESFTLDQLLREMNISQTHFYRKIKFLTGQNPSCFIRTIRLKYATHLLEQHDYPIKEIALYQALILLFILLKLSESCLELLLTNIRKRKGHLFPGRLYYVI